MREKERDMLRMRSQEDTRQPKTGGSGVRHAKKKGKRNVDKEKQDNSNYKS